MERNLEFDLRTCNAAFDFLLNILGVSESEFIMSYLVDCHKDLETFWNVHYEKILRADITDIKIWAFHIMSSLDECAQIKQWGLLNLQEVLSRKTLLSELLLKVGIRFDIPSKIVVYKGRNYSIDYERISSIESSCCRNADLCDIAHRLFYDYCVNGFMMNDNVEDYGGQVHKRPEFLVKLGEVFPEVQSIEEYWKNNATSYRVDFYVYPEQVQRFTFELDNNNDPPYENWCNLDDDMKIKKWMIAYALQRAFNELYSELYLYMKDDLAIPPEQIVSIEPFN